MQKINCDVAHTLASEHLVALQRFFLCCVAGIPMPQEVKGDVLKLVKQMGDKIRDELFEEEPQPFFTPPKKRTVSFGNDCKVRRK